MWKVVTSFNLNPPLKLFFYSPILTNKNLLLKIYYENIVVVFFNQDFLLFILFFFLSFHFHPCFISFFLFSFSYFSPSHKCPTPFFYLFIFHLKNLPAFHICFTAAPASPSPLIVLLTTRLSQIGFFYFILFYFIFACSYSTLF